MKKDLDPTGFPVVGIGASAGGLEALEQFFKNMPCESGMAFVIIQHLDPNHVGFMPELVQRFTIMKVLQVTDNLEIKPNHVYVIPPNKSMSVLNGFLHLFEPTEMRGLRLPVDIFFKSLADDLKEKSIGVVLSGMGSDGSLGLKAIKEKNGLVLVQDPLSAKFSGMPGSAVGSVTADIIASADELSLRLLDHLKFSPAISREIITDDRNKNNLEKIVILLRAQTGHDFSLYKKNTLYRRIERRMNAHRLDKISNYVSFLQKNPKEIEILFKELLIGVTGFFRDAQMWEMLKDNILPDLLKGLPSRHVVRVWIAGCSTGEEAYSFAMVFKEVLENMKLNKNLGLQIFATDIDNDAIEIARKGVFNSKNVADISHERLSRFFISGESSHIISSAVREMIVFAPHDVIRDPPFTRLDFLLCRNLLIYLEPELQKKLVNLFFYSLNPEGKLILGTSENINSQDSLFYSINTKLKIYRRTSTPMEIERMIFPGSFSHAAKQVEEETASVIVSNNLQNFADQLLLQHFAPPSVLINPDGDILYITGRTGKYLEPAAGKANMNIYAMAREGLRKELLNAIRKVRQSYEPVILRNIPIGSDGETKYVDVTIQATAKPDEFKGTIMIVFQDVPSPTKSNPKKSKTGKQAMTSREQDLENELEHSIEELNSLREEMQTSQEELKSTNEELQSTNEELQSTNEELTTSKEELQSLNEELQTVNMELQGKVLEFSEANSDMKNLLNSTDIATLFLDKDLNIRRYTEKLTKLIKLRLTDIGRPFTEMVSDLKYPDIAEHAREVLRTLIFIESDTATSNDKWFRVRIMPYRTMDERIEGLVITFIDITIAKKLEAELKETIKILQEHNLYKT